jgi:regulator of protease activity HflC (stomatin/prohibitin superfamily)
MDTKMKVIFGTGVIAIILANVLCSLMAAKITFLMIDANALSKGIYRLILTTTLAFPPLMLICLFYLKILNPNERGIKVFLGTPRKAVDSGLIFIWWPLEKIVRITKERIELDFNVGEIITNPGLIDPGTEFEERLERVRISVDSGIYISFGGKNFKKNLLQTIQYLPSNIWAKKLDKDALKEYFDQLVSSTIRTIGAKKTWVDINNRRGEFAEEVKEKLIEKDGTFDLSGLADNIEVVITDVSLPNELQEAIRKVEIERKEKIRKIIESEGEKIKRINLAEAAKKEGFAQAAVEAEKVKLELEAQMKALGLKEEEAKNYDLSRRIAKAIENANITAFDGAGIKNIIQEIIKGILDGAKKT